VTAAPLPGWYPDPAGVADLYRWWDGVGWTDAISESAQAPRPGLTPVLDAGDAEAASEPDATMAGRPRSSALRTAVVLTCGFAVFIAFSVC